MQSERQPPSGICPIHCVGWYGNVVALRLLMKTGRVLIDYQDMYGNTALHYATFNGHEEFVKVCIEEFNANLLLVNNGDQSVLGVINDAQLALLPNDDWTSEMGSRRWRPSNALAASRQAKDDRTGHAIAWQAASAIGGAESGATDKIALPGHTCCGDLESESGVGEKD